MRYRARYDVQKQGLVHVQFHFPVGVGEWPWSGATDYLPRRRGASSEKESEMTKPYNGMPADELAVAWQKSSFSNPSGNCVELAKVAHDGGIAVRNSRDPHGPALLYTPAEISAFVLAAKAGEFDHLI
jgi:Domain of unknown function (DUF397)